MKNFQRNLFIVLAIGLCGACAYQWYLQAMQLNTIEGQNRVIFDKSSKIQEFTNSIKRMDAEINQLQVRVTELKRVVSSNDQWAITEKREVARLQSAGDFLSNEIVQYKQTVDVLSNQLYKAYDGEKELAGQRDELARKLNDTIKEMNDRTQKYNQLVERFNQLQATNAPAK